MYRAFFVSILTALLLGGCVSKGAFEQKVRQTELQAEAIAELEQSNDRLIEEKEEVIAQRAELNEQLIAALAENSRLNQEIIRARADLDRDQKAFVAQVDACLATVAEREAEIEHLQQQIAEIEAANAELAAQVEKERLARQARLAKMKNTYDQLVGQLEQEIERGEIVISELEGKLSVNMVERILFDSGEAELKPEGRKVLERVGAILKEVEGKDIRVEGHTDNVPISSRLKDRFPTNWELSTARATNVVHFLQGRIDIPGEKLSVAGYGPYQPIADNDTAEGRAQNRRIQIVLVPPGR